jgi:hypothetical protein
MEDLGPPVAYIALKEGVPVYDDHGQRVGVVEHVLADEQLDIFHGLIVHTEPSPGRHLFADRDQTETMCERGVVLSVGADELHDPEPPAGGDAMPDDSADGPLRSRLRRAWDWLTTPR